MSKASSNGFEKVTPSTLAPLAKSSLNTTGTWLSLAIAQICAS